MAKYAEHLTPLEKTSASRYFKARVAENDLINTELSLRKMLPHEEKDYLQWLYKPDYEASNRELRGAWEDLMQGWGSENASMSRRNDKLQELLEGITAEDNLIGTADPRRMSRRYNLAETAFIGNTPVKRKYE